MLHNITVNVEVSVSPSDTDVPSTVEMWEQNAVNPKGWQVIVDQNILEVGLSMAKLSLEGRAIGQVEVREKYLRNTIRCRN